MKLKQIYQSITESRILLYLLVGVWDPNKLWLTHVVERVHLYDKYFISCILC